MDYLWHREWSGHSEGWVQVNMALMSQRGASGAWLRMFMEVWKAFSGKKDPIIKCILLKLNSNKQLHQKHQNWNVFSIHIYISYYKWISKAAPLSLLLIYRHMLRVKKMTKESVSWERQIWPWHFTLAEMSVLYSFSWRARDHTRREKNIFLKGKIWKSFAFFFFIFN